MLATLKDIVAAQDMLTAEVGPAPIHPSDKNYHELNSDLELLTEADPNFAVINQYIASTMGAGYGSHIKMENVWALRRRPEDASFAPFREVGNHRLLWHGTNVAVVAAILKSGLRIMPHSGGRVGRGIYMANELGA